MSIPEPKQLVKLFIDVLDETGHPTAETITLLLSEHVPFLGTQHRFALKWGENLVGELPAGFYTMQVTAKGYAVSRGAVELKGSEVRQTVTLAERQGSTTPTWDEYLAVYGLKADQLQSIKLEKGQHLVLDHKKYENKSHFTILKPTSLDDLKRWVGIPDSAWGHDQPRFGLLPDPAAVAKMRADAKTAPNIALRSEMNAIAREYIHGNSAAVKKAGFDASLQNQINALIPNYVIPVFFYQVLEIMDGTSVTIGNGSSVFIVHTLILHPTGNLNIVGDVNCIIDTWVQLSGEAPAGTITGKVSDKQKGTPIVGATIKVIDSNGATKASISTDSGGMYSVITDPGSYGLWVFPLKDYQADSTTVTVSSGATTVYDFTLISTAPGTIKGKVTDKQTGMPLAGATVSTGSGSAQTDSAGIYSLTVKPGVWNVSVSLNGYEATSISVTVVSEVSTTEDIALVKAVPGNITGKVTGLDNKPVAGATVSAESVTTVTDAAGNYTLSNVLSGQTTIKAWAAVPHMPTEEMTAEQDINVIGNQTITVNLALTILGPPHCQHQYNSCDNEFRPNCKQRYFPQ